ncbi:MULTISPECIES: acyltransferase family protein [Pseudomonas]|uniref:acyltransferase family protein n=1 Tax=Pseudomonas TaxID=286 RepID=UPI001DD681F8|nr:acyltransferase [Pseudomonas sp. Bi123]CAH0263610.1 O-acetyltransferase OatA [Pseudomonas sp. Bi123]
MRVERHNVDIDALRGIAIILVVSYHMAAVGYIPSAVSTMLANFNGSFGVDLFFLVSGFLVSASLMKILESNSGSFRKAISIYFARRWFRTIIPAAIWVVIWTVLSFLTDGFGEPVKNLNHAVAAVLQWAHLFLYFECVKGNGCGLFGYYWSLSLEEWFYVVLPVLFLCLRMKAMLTVIAGILLVLFALAFVGWSMWGILRIEPMLVGVVIYLTRTKLLVLAERLGRRKWVRWVLPILLLSSMYLTAHCFGKAYVAIVTSCALLFVLSLPDKGYLMGRQTSIMLSVVGKVSFSIYLVHVPLIWLVSHLYEGYSGFGAMLLANGFLFSIIALASFVSYRYLELPSRKLGYRIGEYIEYRSVGVILDEKERLY